ncbi:MAG: GNAT family N-acetyltransferase [Alphaproteobacteria bacterium]|nr:GNAT family N-acetyltransferase [Alphaproteobacteria bacterium]
MCLNIRQLNVEDWALWKHIRLEALKLHPEAFGGSYEEESLWTDEEFKKGLVKSDIFGAFVDNKLVGVAGFFIYGLQKLKHRGMLFTLYVKKENRGFGIATQFMETVIEHARTRVLQLHCTVITGNESAIRLYQRHGFQIFGTEPRSLKVGETFHDLHLMVLKFD